MGALCIWVLIIYAVENWVSQQNEQAISKASTTKRYLDTMNIIMIIEVGTKKSE